MSVFEHRIVALAVATALATGVPRSAAAQTAHAPSIQRRDTTVYHVKSPITPPAVLADSKNTAKPAGAVWVPGFWDLRGNPMTAPHGGWVWVPGRWDEPPARGAQWAEAHWGWSGDWWSWIPGHWDEPEQRK